MFYNLAINFIIILLTLYSLDNKYHIGTYKGLYSY